MDASRTAKLTVGLRSARGEEESENVKREKSKDEKGAMAGTTVEPSKTTHGEITLDLSAAAGPAAEERQEDDQEDVGQEDGQKGGGDVFLLE
eukprot:symbB.v1.2.042125.t1/scaffold9296.1/size5384/1